MPYASIPYEVNDSPPHAELARVAARESMVLLKNQGSLLPLPKDLGSIAVIGPNANDPHVLVGNYFGIPSNPVTPLQGIRARCLAGDQGLVHAGLQATGHQARRAGPGRACFPKPSAWRSAPTWWCCASGLSADIEGEQGDASNSEAAGDKTHARSAGPAAGAAGRDRGGGQAHGAGAASAAARSASAGRTSTCAPSCRPGIRAKRRARRSPTCCSVTTAPRGACRSPSRAAWRTSRSSPTIG